MSKLPGINGKVFDDHPRLKRLCKYVEQNCSEHIPLERAAGIAALEKSYFSSYFRAKVGITFTDWLRHVRVKKAMELLKAKDFSITEVAYEVGFRDLRTFERAFKKYALTTPREFKKSVLP
jgi:transcriptional regulator GlxA family with amidase domain